MGSESLFPGHFPTLEPRPTAETCAEVGVPIVDAGALGPLVLAVGALEDDDTRLGVVDHDASLAAQGSAVVVKQDGGWSHQLTGTSASAALVSGIAGAIWAAVPGRTTALVNTDLIAPAPMLGAPSSATFICNHLPVSLSPHECDSIRRASLCASLEHATGRQLDCDPALASTAAALEADTGGASKTARECKPRSSCPMRTSDDIDSMEQPWGEVGTQPMGNQCGTCEYDRSENRFKGDFVSSMSTAKDGELDVGAQTYSLWTGALNSSSIRRVLSPSPISEYTVTLWYRVKTPIENVWYYEGVQTRVSPFLSHLSPT